MGNHSSYDVARPLHAPHASPENEVLAALGAAPASGLDEEEVRARRAEYGPNLLAHRRPVTALAILIGQLASPVVALLAAAAAVSFAYGQTIEALAIGAVLLLNTMIGYLTESRAIRSMEALRRLGTVTTRIRRAGRIMEVPAQDLVPGDIVLLEGGDIVTADLRLIEAPNLAADESALTGESVPVEKSAALVAAATPVAERGCMAFKGTAITRGGGIGVVVGTGMQTELGRISALVAEAKPERSPLERQLDRLARHLIWVTLALCAAIGAVGIASGEDLFLMVEAAIALAVAAIPEGLPIVTTMALARGMWRMARKNALIERLAAVETLGATTLIFTDKTGTLTENRLSARRIVLESDDLPLAEVSKAHEATGGLDQFDPVLQQALTVAVLCNNAELPSDGRSASGDPVELALLRAGQRGGLGHAALAEHYPRIGGIAFESETAMMATLHRDGDTVMTCVKGAPEAVLQASSKMRGVAGEAPLGDAEIAAWLSRTRELAEDGLRVLAVAMKRESTPAAHPYSDLTFLGLVGLEDPPRADVPEAIRACHDAGIRVVMITGDHAVTARKIAAAIGLADGEATVIEGRALKPLEELTATERRRLLDAQIFARVSPAKKLELIALHQAEGEVVAMTGDGVNDAPALKKADIGVAMGMRGTQVAKQAAAIVLTDDAFATIVHAIREGRIIFRNIQRFVAYLLSCNLSEILVVGLAVLAGLPLPLLPLQILFLNLVTDVFPAFALGVGAGDATILQRPPRDPRKPILTRSVWILIVIAGLAITATTLAGFVLARTWLGLEGDATVTVSFLVLAFAQLWNVFNMRDPRVPLFKCDIIRNQFVWAALSGCTLLLVLVVHIPPLAGALHLSPLPMQVWGIVVVLSLLPVVLVQAGKVIIAKRR
ncbi:MAG: cation-transporting P-type ATPase [Paracoccaceae bacterium]|nr:cation-transporting P-type ATPase [Paracoccaceae bacterium]